LDRTIDTTGPSTANDINQFEEVHLGAGIWNRGNVLIGLYGQWHGHFTSDRRLVVIDIGLVVSHDGLHYHEPIPGFRIVSAREQPDSPSGVFPALMQGQGVENVGDRTLYWYSLWRGSPGSGVRMVSWDRDRLGMLKPYSRRGGQAITTSFLVLNGRPRLFVNASGLGDLSHIRVAVLTDAFMPVAGYAGSDAAVIDRDGLRMPVSWPGGDYLPVTEEPLRLQFLFEGVRPEDAALHAAYLAVT
jgi:hypothetical protein